LRPGGQGILPFEIKEADSAIQPIPRDGNTPTPVKPGGRPAQIITRHPPTPYGGFLV